MKNSTMIKRETGSNRCETSKVGIRNRLKIIATSALLLAATNATAGIIFLPGSNIYTAPQHAQMTISQCPGDFNVASCVRIHTTGLTGELTISKVNTSGNDESPPVWDIATTEKVVLPFEQELDLIIDLAGGAVSGRFISKSMDTASTRLAATAEVRGNATCLPLNGLECGQLVVDLELQGVVSDPNAPAIIGKLEMDVLGSLYFDGSDVGLGSWVAMSANTTIGGNEGLINSFSWASGDFNTDG